MALKQGTGRQEQLLSLWQSLAAPSCLRASLYSPCWEMGLGVCKNSRGTAFQLLSGEREHSMEKRYITQVHQSPQPQGG